ncbi:hypothetical protein VTO42DRAFT_7172 [Malbranchea cinnamomea]
MGKVIQKRKNRSSAPKVKQKSRKAKNGNKKINVRGNAIIAANWDKKLTLTQNYRRLGLTSRLNVPAGGSEKLPSTSTATGTEDPLHASLVGTRHEMKLKPAEARVERDPKTGKILRVIRDDEEEEMVEVAGKKRRKVNPLDDPLEELPQIGEPVVNGAAPTGVVAELERQAALEEEALKKRKPRHQSQREIEWLERLVQKYGDDTRAMARDRKLNPMQQTEADIARRLRKWRETQK